MIELDLLFQAFGTIAQSLDILLMIVIGTLIGIVFGAVPGLSGTVAIALLIPLSYYLSPIVAISAMYAIQKGGAYGGSITAILMNLPGTPAAACTVLDGYPLTLQGKSGKALQTATLSSGIADLLSDLVLIFATFRLATLVWAFGPVEITGILFFALTLIASVAGRSPLKGVLSALLGLLFAMIGLDPMSGGQRFLFGLYYLSEGLPLVPVLTGLFVVSEVLLQVQKSGAARAERLSSPPPRHPDDNRITAAEFRGLIPTLLSSWFVGMVIGIIPGLGGAIAPWVSYGQAKSFSKNPDEFGKGSLKGVAAAEAANNAVSGANLIPLLTLGLPGSTSVALIMSVFMMNGIRFGPRIFEQHGVLVYGIYVAGLIAILVYTTVGLLFARHIGRLVARIRVSIVFPIILVLTFIGAYAGANNLTHIVILIVFGAIGFLLRCVDFPLPPLIIAFLLGERFERAIRQSVTLTDRGAMVFLTNPVSLVMILLAIILLAYNVYRQAKTRRSNLSPYVIKEGSGREDK